MWANILALSLVWTYWAMTSMFTGNFLKLALPVTYLIVRWDSLLNLAGMQWFYLTHSLSDYSAPSIIMLVVLCWLDNRLTALLLGFFLVYSTTFIKPGLALWHWDAIRVRSQVMVGCSSESDENRKHSWIPNLELLNLLWASPIKWWWCKIHEGCPQCKLGLTRTAW